MARRAVSTLTQTTSKLAPTSPSTLTVSTLTKTLATLPPTVDHLGRLATGATRTTASQTTQTLLGKVGGTASTILSHTVTHTTSYVSEAARGTLASTLTTLHGATSETHPRLPAVGQLLPPAQRELSGGHLPLGPSSPVDPGAPLAPSGNGPSGPASSAEGVPIAGSATSPTSLPTVGVESFSASATPSPQTSSSLCCTRPSRGAVARSAGRPGNSAFATGLANSIASATGIATAAAALHVRGIDALTPGGSIPAPAPLPTPAPPAGSSSSTAGSSGGFGSIIFLSLAGLLAWGAPQALRRLRLASESRRPAPFVLIADRPG